MSTTHHHSTDTHHPEGRVDAPGLLYGAIGLVLAVTMHVVGLFKQGDVRLKDALLDSVFQERVPDVLSLPVMVLVAAVFCFGLSFAVLDSAGTWRRVILGVSSLVVLMAMIPTLAVWNIYFSPFLPVVAVFWSWFCTMMYVHHHHMPCDASRAAQVRVSQVVATAQAAVSVSAAAADPEKTEPLEGKEKGAGDNEVLDQHAKYKPQEKAHEGEA